MRPPRILFVANTVLGWSTYAEQFAEVLAARSDVQAEVFRRKPSRLWMQLARRHADAGAKRHLRPFDPIGVHASAMGRDIRAAVARYTPDVVHFAAHWPAGAIAGQADAPPFTLALDATRACLTSDLPLPGWSPAECEAEAQLCRRAAHLFPMSRWAANSLTGDYGIPAGQVTVTPPSLRSGPRNAPLPREDKPQILFIGNDLARKGASRLARWVEGPLQGRCHLHIVSSDRRPPPTGANITFHGRVPHDRLMGELMPRMDLFCLPTRLDMSPFVLVEAAASGLPAVASDLGGIGDLIEHGTTGLLVPPEDEAGFVEGLTRLIDTPDLRHDMGRAAQTRAARCFDAKANFSAVIDRLVKIATATRTAA